MSSILLFFLLILVSCSDVPPREKFPGGAGRTTDTERAQTQKAVLGGFDAATTQLPGSNAAAPRGAAGTGSSDSPAKLSGTISLGKGLSIPPGAKLYVSVRKPGGGPPIAAKRFGDAKLPIDFKLSDDDQIMMGGGPSRFEGEVEVTARLDQDGDPMTRDQGDLFGLVRTTVGDLKIKISINSKVD